MVPTHVPDPALLSGRDWQAVLAVVGDLVDAIDDGDGFARCGIERLANLAASDITTLSLCDLQRGRRHVIGSPGVAIDAEARAAFDRHFHEHPLVRHHAYERGAHAHRISDSVPFAAFRESALYDEYYQRIGIDHTMALPVLVNDRWLVSFVLNRSGRDFSDQEVARIDQVRSSIGRLFARTHLLEQAQDTWRPAPAAPALPPVPGLTAREHEVLVWVAAGKTDRDIAQILSISHRTVHKHLQRTYAKLGVETRTAAVMRVMSHT